MNELACGIQVDEDILEWVVVNGNSVGDVPRGRVIRWDRVFTHGDDVRDATLDQRLGICRCQDAA